MQFKFITYAALFGASVATVQAGEVTLNIEVPRLDVAEYHRPYVAAWIETDKGKHQQDLSLWYDDDMKDNEGTTWLKDLRRWWRRSGRQLSFPVDGLSSATRAVGMHELKFSIKDQSMKDLPSGNYRLLVEASREVGGREVLTLPFSWPVTVSQSSQQQGKHELGLVQLSLNP